MSCPISNSSPKIAFLRADGRVITTSRHFFTWPGLSQSATFTRAYQVTSRSKLFSWGVL